MLGKLRKIKKKEFKTKENKKFTKILFECDLKIEEIDILTEWMVYEWLTPYLNNIENLRNQLNTKDFSFFSPANLLSTIQNVHTASRKRAKSMMNEYSYVNSDLEKLKA